MGDLELGLKKGEELSASPPPKSAEGVIPVDTLVLPDPCQNSGVQHVE